MKTAMKCALSSILVVFFGLGVVVGQAPDLAASYYHFSLAKMHEATEQYSEAISEFEKAISLDPQSGRLRVVFAETLLKMGEVQRAISECQTAAELNPEISHPHYLLGQIYMNSRKSDQRDMRAKAIEEYRRTVELDPQHSEALFYLGQLQLEEGDYQNSVVAFDQFLEIQPWVGRGYLGKAKALLGLNEVQDALQTLEQALDYDETDPEIIRALGGLYEHTQQEEKARRLYNQLLEENTDSEIRFRLARVLTRQQQFEEAVPVLRELTSGSSDVRLNAALGEALKGNKEYEEAVKAFEEVIRVDPNHFAANYMLGETLTQLGERQRAIERFLHLLDLNQSSQDRGAIETNLALLYQETRQFDKAVELFRTISRASPEDDVAKLRLAYALKEAGRLPEALALSSELLNKYLDRKYEDYADKKYVVIARAQMLSAADRLDKAMDLVKAEIPQLSDPEELYLVASQLQIDHKRYGKAEKIIRQGMSRYPKSEKIQFQLGAIHERLGQLARAESVFKEIIVRNPEHAGALNYLGYMLAERGVRLLEALDYIQEAVDIDPHNGAYLDSLGWVYFKLKELDKAEVNLIQASQLNDGDSTIYDHLGDLYRERSQYEKAKNYYEQSISFSAEKEELKKVRKKLRDLERLLSDQNRR